MRKLTGRSKYDLMINTCVHVSTNHGLVQDQISTSRTIYLYTIHYTLTWRHARLSKKMAKEDIS